MFRLSSSEAPEVTQPGSRRLFPIPFAGIAAGLILTFLATYYLNEWQQSRAGLAFSRATQQIRERLQVRLAAYVAILRGGAGLFAVRKVVLPHEFRTYVDGLRVPANYPGVQGIGFSYRIPPGTETNVIQFLRLHGMDHFELKGETPPGGERHAIVYLEPQDARNRAALGYDMFAEEVRREAMIRARDTGEPAASRRVTLVQEIEGPKQPGFLVYVPVYSGDEVPETIEQRQERLMGFVYSPFRLGDLLEGVLGPEEDLDVRMELYDGGVIEPDSLMLTLPAEASARPGKRSQQVPIDFAGHRWMLQFHALPRSWWVENFLVAIVALGGTTSTLALGYLFYGREREFWRAERSMRALRASQAEIQELNRTLERRVDERTRALREVNEQMEVFIYSMAHDLRAPLRAMKSFSDVLLEDYSNCLDSEGRALIERIKRASIRMDALVRDLMQYSKVAQGEVSLAPIALCSVIDSVLTHFSQEIEERRAIVDVDANLPAVLAHGSTLELVVGNLVSNALKYVAPGKQPRLDIHASTSNGVTRLRFQDNGIGIDPNHSERIFEVFERLHSPEQYPGTGIGLSIVKKGLSRMNGRVGLTSVPGQGSCFWVELATAPPGVLPPPFHDHDRNGASHRDASLKPIAAPAAGFANPRRSMAR